MKIYLIPGLGFDHRIFGKLELDGHELHYLDWIEPQQDESFQSYVTRLADPISEPHESCALIGHSLGGMASLEISSIKNVSHVFLISSVRSREEIPPWFRAVGPAALHNLFTKRIMLSTFKLWGHTQDYKTPEEQNLFISMVEKQTDNYLQWALKRLSLWQTPDINEAVKVTQIHGRGDKTFPAKFLKNSATILENAGHFMVYKHPEQISRIIIDTLLKNI